MKTTGCSRAFRPRMTASVNVSQPRSLCEAGSWARTVSTALSSMTPCSAQGVRWPFSGRVQTRSSRSALKMLNSGGRGGIHAALGAKVVHDTLRTLGRVRGAGVAAEQHHRRPELDPLFLRHDRHQVTFDPLGFRLLGQPEALADAGHVRVHDDAGG